VDEAEARRRVETAVADGSASAAYERWIRAQGGDPDEAALPEAGIVREVAAGSDGWVSDLGALDIGLAALRLGAGRRTKEDTIDHAVGIRCFAKRGDVVEVGQPLAAVYAPDETAAEHALERVRTLISIADEPQPPRPIVLETLA
jgi:thymidine phosphorylase